MNKFAFALAAAAVVTNPAMASSIKKPSATQASVVYKEIYVGGFLHLPSIGISAIGNGSFISYLQSEGVAESICASGDKATVYKLVGHSYGASAVIRMTNTLHQCGVRVAAAAFLDPQTHPRAFGLPKNVKTLTMYSPGWRGVGEGHADSETFSGGHVFGMGTGGANLRVRKFLDSVR